MPLISGEIYIGKIEEQILLNDIHYRYNFIIQPVENNEKIHINEYGYWINYIYPSKLNFTLEESIIIRYIIEEPQIVKNIKLDPDSSSYLECEDLIGMKKCIVPLNHFKKEEEAYYYTHHLNHLYDYSINYEVNPIKVIFTPSVKTIEIKIEDQYNTEELSIGPKGTLAFITSYIDNDNIFDPSDIENYTFESIIIDDNNNNYKVICRLWKPKDINLRLLCDMNETLINSETNINLNMTNFTYKNNNVVIISSLTSLVLQQYKIEIPFLYSDNQIINIKEEQDIYEIKFKLGNYNNDILFLYSEFYNSLALYNPKKEGKELIFELKKEKIEEYLQNDTQIFEIIGYIESYGYYSFPQVFKIIFTESDIIKKINY